MPRPKKTETTKKVVRKVTTTKKTAAKSSTSTRKPGRPKKSEAAQVALEKILREEEKELASRPISNVKEIPYTVKDSLNKKDEYIIVLDSKGNLYVEQIPQYCDFNLYRAFAACTSEISENDNFSFRVNMSFTSYNKMEITTGTYDSPKTLNPFTSLFDIKNSTKAIGGNIVFTMPDRGFTKKEVDKYYKVIVKDLQKEITIDVSED